ncbi:MAG: glycosyltransferase family 4 protein [Cyclobacteriaceae bacterium]
MESLKITFCTGEFPDHFSGVNTWIMNLSSGLLKFGITPHIIDLTFGEGNFSVLNFCSNQGLEFDRIQVNNGTTSETLVKYILKILKSRGTDVFIPGYVDAAHYAIPYLTRAKLSTVIVLHSDDLRYKAYYDDFVVKESDYRAHVVVAVSDFIYRWVDGLPGTIVKSKIYCGITIPDVKKQYSTSAKKLKLVYCGRLDQEQKRVLDTFDAFNALVSQVSNISCHFIGNGFKRPELLRRINSEGNNLITYDGQFESEKLQTKLLEYDIFILLSDYEGLPVGLLEAMSLGMTCICLRTQSGVCEVIEHMKTGVLVEDRGPSLVKMVKQLASERHLLEAIGSSARKLVICKYSSEQTTKKWIKLIEKIGPNDKVSIKIPNRIKIKIEKNPALDFFNTFNKELRTRRYKLLKLSKIGKLFRRIRSMLYEI